jgi:hypothetical protein
VSGGESQAGRPGASRPDDAGGEGKVVASEEMHVAAAAATQAVLSSQELA